MNASNKQKMIIAGALILLLLSLLITGFSITKNKALNKNLNSEILKTELILSEKLLLDKEIALLKEQMLALKGTNSEIDKILAETSKKLSDKEAELKRISRENSNVKSLKKQLEEVNKLRNDLENQVALANSSISKLNAEKDMLNKTIDQLKAENRELADNLKILSSVTADNFLVETSKGKGKLTVKAKRTNKIAVSFKVPSNLTENLNCKIIKPDGSMVKADDRAITYNLSDEEDLLYASINSGDIKISRKIEMVYQPKEKLKPGIYRIEIYNGDNYVGSSNVRLR